jgi:hypothetical protein
VAGRSDEDEEEEKKEEDLMTSIITITISTVIKNIRSFFHFPTSKLLPGRIGSHF